MDATSAQPARTTVLIIPSPNYIHQPPTNGPRRSKLSSVELVVRANRTQIVSITFEKFVYQSIIACYIDTAVRFVRWTEFVVV